MLASALPWAQSLTKLRWVPPVSFPVNVIFTIEIRIIVANNINLIIP